MKTIIKQMEQFLGALLLISMLSIGCTNQSGKESATNTAAAAAVSANTEVASEASDPMMNKGVGPVTSVQIAEIDNVLVGKGKTLFEGKCTSCHKIEAKHVGPALAGVTKRRSPEWIMNMILNPGDMTQKDPIAKELLATFMAPMANQSLTEEEARNILEYFRSIDK